MMLLGAGRVIEVEFDEWEIEGCGKLNLQFICMVMEMVKSKYMCNEEMIIVVLEM